MDPYARSMSDHQEAITQACTASCRADEWHRHHHSVDPSASDSGRDDSHPMTGRSSAHSVQSSHDSPRSSGEANIRARSSDTHDGHSCPGSMQHSTIAAWYPHTVLLRGRQDSCRGRRRRLDRTSTRTTMTLATGGSQCAGRTHSS